MPIRNDTYNIVKAASNADFDNEYYYAIYSIVDTTVTVNGLSLPLVAGVIINIDITSISATANVFIIGDKKTSVDASTALSRYPEPTPPEPTPDTPNAAKIAADFITAIAYTDTDGSMQGFLESFADELIRENLWDKMIAIYPFITDARDVAGYQSQFKYNFKDPQDTDEAYRLTFNGSLGLANQGITSMGGGNWIDTHISSAGVFTDDRPTFGYSNITITDNRYGVIGSKIGASLSYNYIQFTWPFSAGYRIDMDSSPYSTDTLSGWDGIGTHIFSRMTDTDVRIISSNGTKQTRTIPIEGLADVEFTIGLKTAANEGINTNTISFVFFSNKLEDDEASAFQIAVGNLLSSLGRIL